MTPTKTLSEPRSSERVAVQTGQTMNYYTENKRLSNTTLIKTVSEPRRSERVAVQTGQTMTYKTLHRK